MLEEQVAVGKSGQHTVSIWVFLCSQLREDEKLCSLCFIYLFFPNKKSGTEKDLLWHHFIRWEFFISNYYAGYKVMRLLFQKQFWWSDYYITVEFGTLRLLLTTSVLHDECVCACVSVRPSMYSTQPPSESRVCLWCMCVHSCVCVCVPVSTPYSFVVMWPFQPASKCPITPLPSPMSVVERHNNNWSTRLESKVFAEAAMLYWLFTEYWAAVLTAFVYSYGVSAYT